MAFEKDDLGRAPFADLLVGLTTSLAAAEVLPSGRVIAVDAPWGSGKSWIAKQLPDHFNNQPNIGKCVYVDAYEFDFHQDPFAVVTSVILDAYKDEPVALKNFKKTAIDVMRSSLPAIGKGVVKVGGKLIGVDTGELYESFVETGSDVSEKAIEKMLDTFSQTRETTKKFKDKLTELVRTNGNDKPLVVVIDELDRCRPSFALEMLERVKHLFDVPNVMFIFFVHSKALHSAISKTYGHEINAEEYLRKFITLTIGLPTNPNVRPNNESKVEYFSKFIETQFPFAKTKENRDSENTFRERLADFSVVLFATFRDIENAMLFWQILKTKVRGYEIFFAYLLLIKIRENQQFNLLTLNPIEAFNFELKRLGAYKEGEVFSITLMRDLFAYMKSPAEAVNRSNTQEFRVIFKSHNSIENFNLMKREFNKILKVLEIEYIRL